MDIYIHIYITDIKELKAACDVMHINMNVHIEASNKDSATI